MCFSNDQVNDLETNSQNTTRNKQTQTILLVQRLFTFPGENIICALQDIM